MLLVIGLLPKAVTTLLADIRVLPGVHADVLDKVGLPHKLLVAHVAWEPGLRREAHNEKQHRQKS